MNRQPRGFTLIEMLVVMAIVAMLLTVALPRYFGSLEKAKELALKENLKILRITLDQFYADKGRYPESLEQLVGERYLKAIPLDPITESTMTWVVTGARNPDLKGIADVRSGATGMAADGHPYEGF